MSSSWRDLNSRKIATTIQLLKINLKIEKKKVYLFCDSK